MRRNLTIVLLAAAVVAAGGCKKKAQESGAPGEPAGQPAGETPTQPEKAAEPAKPPEPALEPTDPVPPPEPAKAATPAEILDKAIEAAGGLDNLKAKLAAATIESEGTFYGKPYKSTTYWKAPDRMVMNIVEMGMTMGYTPEACWSTMGEIVIDCMKEEQEYSGEGLSYMHAMNLYALKEEGVQVEAAGEADLDGTATLGVKVSGGFLKMPVTFFFAKDSGLLLKAVYDGHFGMEQGTIEYRYSDHKDFDGLKLAGASTMTINGKEVMTEKILAVKLGEVDEARFSKPAQAPFGEARATMMPAQTVAVTKLTGPYDKIGEGVGALMGWVSQKGLMPMGAPMMVFVKGPADTENPEEFETELWLSVAWIGERPADEEAFQLRDVPATEVVWRLEQGPFEQASGHFGELATWAGENGYELAGPPTMAAFSDPNTTPPEQILSALSFPVTKKP